MSLKLGLYCGKMLRCRIISDGYILGSDARRKRRVTQLVAVYNHQVPIRIEWIDLSEVFKAWRTYYTKEYSAYADIHQTTARNEWVEGSESGKYVYSGNVSDPYLPCHMHVNSST